MLDSRRRRLARRRPAPASSRAKPPGRCRPGGGKRSAPPRPCRWRGWPSCGRRATTITRPTSRTGSAGRSSRRLPVFQVRGPADWVLTIPGTAACRGRSAPPPSTGAPLPAGRPRRRGYSSAATSRSGSTSTRISRMSPPFTVTYDTSLMRLMRRPQIVIGVVAQGRRIVSRRSRRRR